MSAARDKAAAELRDITGATLADATRLLKRAGWRMELAIDLYYSDATAQANAAFASGEKERQKKLGEIWEKFKDRDSKNPQRITIEGTMQLCQQLDIDPDNDIVMLCLATDLGSKSVGSWEKQPWVEGWSAMGAKIDSLAKMKAHLPVLRKQVVSDPAYFKKVYMHTFELSKADGARTILLEMATAYWKFFIPAALKARPSALSRMLDPDNDPSLTSDPEFTEDHLDLWIEFHEKKARAISKDTWSLFIDFVRTIDAKFETFDEDGAWPSTIDEFVEFVRERQKA